MTSIVRVDMRCEVGAMNHLLLFGFGRPGLGMFEVNPRSRSVAQLGRSDSGQFALKQQV